MGGIGYMIYKGHFQQAWNYVSNWFPGTSRKLSVDDVKAMSPTEIEELRTNPKNRDLLDAAGLLEVRGKKSVKYLVPGLVGTGLLAAAGVAGAAYAYKTNKLTGCIGKVKKTLGMEDETIQARTEKPTPEPEEESSIGMWLLIALALLVILFLVYRQQTTSSDGKVPEDPQPLQHDRNSAHQADPRDTPVRDAWPWWDPRKLHYEL